ncbi:PREDICTED: serine/threonine-protein kinase-like protein CR4 isoform X1 [Lupinus angustifolius]|uniref:serine/threonine-protein kinase-like protein CR4 isoform X1 n=1 Tax=Lupinus angustifolius TaxID=3871 RepID=UPI00092E72B9|nr:PREDICTED: serine/threonine-protein kinase-like protein CR4 isoform X1 [Lupinus angustifolius]
MITNYKMDHAQYIIAYYLVMVTLSTSLMVLCVVLFLICKKKPIDSVETLPVKLCAQAYSLIDIDAATDGFNNRRIVGKGRLGTVYVGVLEKGEKIVALKRIHQLLVLKNAGFGFSSVLKCLSSVQHPNIVPIIGFSEAPGERIIVMELVRMVSLDFYLHQNVNGASLLDWNKRIRIVAGACKGLQYLHEMVAPSIVHGCVKSSNILIDVNFCARISDYGLNFLAPFEKRGLEGYVDYEYWNGSGASKESDVYGLGVVILEILSGRGCEEGLLEKWALPLIKEMCFSELLDPRLVIPSNMKPLVRLAKVASACVGNSRKCRPSMAQVATILNNLEMEMCM